MPPLSHHIRRFMLTRTVRILMECNCGARLRLYHFKNR
uniref:Uncharacterized protein n=1 Tax=Anguilla anguilla TaxID=7936 RepID=A0A0E9P8Q5_ANGAN